MISLMRRKNLFLWLLGKQSIVSQVINIWNAGNSLWLLKQFVDTMVMSIQFPMYVNPNQILQIKHQVMQLKFVHCFPFQQVSLWKRIYEKWNFKFNIWGKTLRFKIYSFASSEENCLKDFNQIKPHYIGCVCCQKYNAEDTTVYGDFFWCTKFHNSTIL